VEGNVGPDNSGVSASADSSFTVNGSSNVGFTKNTPKIPQQVLEHIIHRAPQGAKGQ